MKWIRQRVLAGELTCGSWIGLGSSLVAEIAGNAGLDWLVLDMEHGYGDHGDLVSQIQAVTATPAAPVVRVAWNDPPRFKRVLDLGACGVMVPWVNSAEEARRAVAAMRYPPEGIRGLSRASRASGFGRQFEEYFATVNDSLLTVVQTETAAAVDAAKDIAAVDGVDVLFVGPADLSLNLGGVKPDFDEPVFAQAIARILKACSDSGKSAGILTKSRDQLEKAVEIGFTFVAFRTDIGIVTGAMNSVAEAFEQVRRRGRE